MCNEFRKLPCFWLLALSPLVLTAIVSGKELRLNQIQIIGTHNSYHLRPDKQILLSPRGRSLDYGHAPLFEQLESGVRSLALDIYKEAETFRVLHIPGWDDRSNCAHLKECLGEVIRWSDANPRHIPLIVFIEIKNLKEKKEGFEPMTSEDIDQLEDLIWLTVGENKLLNPDDVRGNHATLEESVLKNGWPFLDDVRGKIIIQLNGPTDLQAYYAKAQPSLAGRSMFLKVNPGEPEAAIVVANHPEQPNVNELARQGYLVRTRADISVKEPATNDTSKRDAALNSGAHIITTDFPSITPHPKTGYLVAFPDQADWRPNPLLAPREEN